MKSLSDADKIDYLLSELCADLGFCSPLRDPARFEKLLPFGIDGFY
jgi:hypothetical protein